MQIEYFKTSTIIPYAKNPRKNEHAVTDVASSIKEFGFNCPILLDKNKIIIAGHTRYFAAKQLELEKVPCLVLKNLTPAKAKAYRLLDNKLAEKALWDFVLLKEEIQELEGHFDFSIFDVNFLYEENQEEIEKLWSELVDTENEEIKNYKSVIVHFETEDYFIEFQRKINQKISKDTKYIYYPEQIKNNNIQYQYKNEE